MVNKVKLWSLKPAPGVEKWCCESLSGFLTCLTNRVVGSQVVGLCTMRLQMSMARNSMDVRTCMFLGHCSMLPWPSRPVCMFLSWLALFLRNRFYLSSFFFSTK